MREGSVTFKVRVIPRAGRTGIAGTRGDALLVRVAAPPADGAANAALVRLLAVVLGVPPSAVALISGERSRHKRVAVSGASVDAVAAALSAVLPA